MKRLLAALLVTASTGVGSASASSFVVLPAMQEKLGPSMIALGTPAPAAETVAARAAAEPAPAFSTTPDRVDAADAFTLAAAAMLSESPIDAPGIKASTAEVPAAPAGSFVAISPSIIAMGEIPPPVSFEQVSAVGKTAPGRRLEPKPMVIRGGDVGEAFSYGSGVPAREGRSGRQTASTSDGAPGKPEPQQPATAPLMPRTQVE